jgi:hypothetical protein
LDACADLPSKRASAELFGISCLRCGTPGAPVDLNQYGRVIWRFRFLVLFGLLVALALTFLSFWKVSPHGITYRQKETWQAGGILYVTQPGFPEGRLSSGIKLDANGNPVTTNPYADPSRLATLALFYSTIANSDAVSRLAHEGGPLPGAFTADVVRDPINRLRGNLPFVTITGLSTTPAGAVLVAQRGVNAVRQYVEDQQAANRIPPRQRVRLDVVNAVKHATLAKGRRLTIPIVIFVTVMIATLGLAFILENVRPRVHAVAGGAEGAEAAPGAGRQTA